MNSENEFDCIAQAVKNITSAATSSDATSSEDMIRRMLESIIAKSEQQTKYSLPEKPDPTKEPEPIVESYVVPKGTDIMIPKPIFGKVVLHVLDFVTITTTRDVKYGPVELVYDGTTDYTNLPVNIGIWANQMIGFQLPPNNKQVEFFLVLKRWVDITVKTEYTSTTNNNY